MPTGGVGIERFDQQVCDSRPRDRPRWQVTCALSLKDGAWQEGWGELCLRFPTATHSPPDKTGIASNPIISLNLSGSAGDWARAYSRPLVLLSPGPLPVLLPAPPYFFSQPLLFLLPDPLISSPSPPYIFSQPLISSPIPPYFFSQPPLFLLITTLISSPSPSYFSPPPFIFSPSPHISPLPDRLN